MKKYSIFIIFLSVKSLAVVISTPGKIQVSAAIKGDAETLGVFGDTLDYLKFEMMSSGIITINSIHIGGAKYMLAEYLGIESEFGFIDNPYRLEVIAGAPFNAPLPSLTRQLNAGTYILVAGRGGNRTSYDVYDGFVALNPEGGGFTSSSYSYEIIGDVRPLEFRSGNLDNTFTITTYPVPEPSTYALLGLGLASLAWLRRR